MSVNEELEKALTKLICEAVVVWGAQDDTEAKRDAIRTFAESYLIHADNAQRIRELFEKNDANNLTWEPLGEQSGG